MPRKTAKLTEIRALTNRYLAGSDPELVDFRRGVAAMYEHLAMAANVYHGYNDIVQVWAGEPGQGTYVPDETYRRQYFGPVDGPDAQPAEEAIRAYRENATDPELMRRRREATAIKMRQLRAVAARDTETTCHCGAAYRGADHCPACGCEQYESLRCDFIKASVTREDVRIGQGDGWLVNYRGERFVISTDNEGNSAAFRCNERGRVTDWDEVARGVDKYDALTALEARPAGDDGRVQSPRDVLDAQEAAEDARTDAERERDRRAAAGDDQAQDAQYEAEHPTGVPPGIAPERRQPVDQALYDRTAPAYNCVTHPGRGPHYITETDQPCLWCGMTLEQRRAEAHCCSECEGSDA